nr:super-infection exclusion protein B [Planococcus sp. 4-30]
MVALFLTSGILVFSPVSIPEKLFMIGFREQNGFAIGIVFIVSISILTINLIYSISKLIQSAGARNNFIQARK